MSENTTLSQRHQLCGSGLTQHALQMKEQKTTLLGM